MEVVNGISRPELNGQRAKVLKYIPDSKEYQVKFNNDGKKRAIPWRNLI